MTDLLRAQEAMEIISEKLQGGTFLVESAVFGHRTAWNCEIRMAGPDGFAAFGRGMSMQEAVTMAVQAAGWDER